MQNIGVYILCQYNFYNKKIVKPNKFIFFIIGYTTFRVNLSGADIQTDLLLPVLDNATYNIPCEKTDEA